MMGWITLIGFPLLAIVLLNWFHGSWQFIFTNGWPIYWQLVPGIVLGVLIGFSLRIMLKAVFMNKVSLRYADMVRDFGLSRQEFIFLSVCAGVGEEILFRGAFQTFFGIPITAVGFVAIHGYLNPRDWRIFLYGTVLSLIFIGVGYMMQEIGIYSCIVLHAIIDVILFDFLLDSTAHEN